MEIFNYGTAKLRIISAKRDQNDSSPDFHGQLAEFLELGLPILAKAAESTKTECKGSTVSALSEHAKSTCAWLNKDPAKWTDISTQDCDIISRCTSQEIAKLCNTEEKIAEAFKYLCKIRVLVESRP